MKRLAAITILSSALFLTGCVQMHMDTIIEKDGSGTFTINYAMSQEVAEAIQELQNMDMPNQSGMDEAPTLDDFKKEEIEKSCKDHDVKLKKFDRTTVEGKEKLEMVMEFENIDDLSDALASTIEEQGSLKIFKTPDGNYNLRTVEVKAKSEEEEDIAETEDSFESSGQEAEEYDPEKMGKSMEIMGKLMSSISELDVAMRITVPSEIISHNAQRVEGKTLIWEINSTNIMSGEVGNMEPDIVFSGEGVKIKAPLQE